MGAIHATERLTNAKARLFAHLGTVALSGAPKLVIDGDQRFRPDAEERFVRLGLEPMAGASDGYAEAGQRARGQRALFVADIFWRDAGAEGEPHNVYAIDRTAEELAHALRGLALGAQDYATDPSAPTAIAGYPLRVLDEPRILRLPPDEGFDRRQVTAELRWFARVAA